MNTLRFGASTSKIMNQPKQHHLANGVHQLKNLLKVHNEGISRNVATIGRLDDELATYRELFKLLSTAGLDQGGQPGNTGGEGATREAKVCHEEEGDAERRSSSSSSSSSSSRRSDNGAAPPGLLLEQLQQGRLGILDLRRSSVARRASGVSSDGEISDESSEASGGREQNDSEGGGTSGDPSAAENDEAAAGDDIGEP